MITLSGLRSTPQRILVLGNHAPIIQSILDFDYLTGKGEGSIIGIVTGRPGYAKYFFGRQEILLPTFTDISSLESGIWNLESNLWFLNLLSGRRAHSSIVDLLTSNISPLKSHLVGGVIFAENVPELHSLQLISSNSLESNISHLSSRLIIGPASVGLLIPGMLKLGPIGGITPTQIREGHLTEPGNIAILSASGGMTNELINIAVGAGHSLSFALSFGGDRFPILSPRDAFLLAESDPATSTVLYYGELGGEDEYELVQLKSAGLFTKSVIAHVAGTVASLFSESPQFGHAKAKADKAKTTALAKRAALQSAGFQVSQSFTEFIRFVNKLK